MDRDELLAGQLLTDLHFAAESIDIRHAAELLTAGANPNARDADGHTPLHFSIDAEVEGEEAIGFASTAMTHLLLVFGADPSIRNNFGETPTDWAARRHHDSALQVISHLRSHMAHRATESRE